MTLTTITNSEYDKIVDAVQLYIDGFNERDIEKFRKAFHKEAWMFFTDKDGVLHTMPLEEKLFRSWTQPSDGTKVELRILSVAQMGDAAGVALAFGDEWMDFHTLVRIDGEWKITNKTASHRSR